jgi:hypothetical protein
MASSKVHIPMLTFRIMIDIREISCWAMIQLHHTLSLLKQESLILAISYSPFHLALLVLLLPSYGVSIASINQQILLLDSQLYPQATSNISMLMAAKMDEISSECSRQVTGLSSGFSTTNIEPIKELHIALLEGHSTVKKSLLPSIQVQVRPLFTLGL